MITIDLGEVYYQIDQTGVKSIWNDNKVLHGIFSYEDEDFERAVSLGYTHNGISNRKSAIESMHREHDLAHHLIMQALGWPSSVVLRCIAEGREVPAGIGQIEERLALLLQRISNEGILKVAQNSP